MSATIHITAKFGPKTKATKKKKEKDLSTGVGSSSTSSLSHPFTPIKSHPHETPSDYNSRLILNLCRNYLNRFIPTTIFFRDVTDPNEHNPLSTTKSSKKIHWQTMTTLEVGDFANLTDKYVKPTLYEECVAKIRAELCGKHLWASISTSGRFEAEYNYVNVIVGTFGGKMKTFLVACKEVRVLDPDGLEEGEEKQFYLDLWSQAMSTLYPSDPTSWPTHILLLLTEPLDGMYHAALQLRTLAGPSLLHVTCLNRTLHLLEQLIILPSEDLATCTTSSFTPSTFTILLDFYAHIRIIGRSAFAKLSALPPLPASAGPLDNLLEWTDYVHRHFTQLRLYLASTDTFWGRDSLLGHFESTETRRHLTTLKVKYASLAHVRRSLSNPVNQAEQLRLEEFVGVVEEFRVKLGKWPDEFEQKLAGMFAELLDINEGYGELKGLCRGEKESIDGIDTQNLPLLQHAPLAALTRGQCFPRFEQLLGLYPDYPIPPEAMSVYSVIYCTKEMMNRASGIDEKKIYYQLNYRQEMHDKGLKLKELGKNFASLSFN